tara:strand:+ start:98 stop:541 length:444 start_codon:yes stop_codon:yes gene_type:complete
MLFIKKKYNTLLDKIFDVFNNAPLLRNFFYVQFKLHHSNIKDKINDDLPESIYDDLVNSIKVYFETQSEYNKDVVCTSKIIELEMICSDLNIINKSHIKTITKIDLYAYSPYKHINGLDKKNNIFLNLVFFTRTFNTVLSNYLNTIQ